MPRPLTGQITRNIVGLATSYDGANEESGSYMRGSIAGTTAGLLVGGGGAGAALSKAANSFDDIGRCANVLTKLRHGGCFVAGTLVTVSEMLRSEQLDEMLWGSSNGDELVDAIAGIVLTQPVTATARGTGLLIPIEDVPLGARVPTKNPRPWEFDDSLPEPNETTWAKLSITMHRNDGGIVDAELIRPKSWIEANRIEAGKLLPMDIEELQVTGHAVVTSIDACPAIADGQGSVVTARFVTRQVDTIARVEILGADGQVEVLEGTTIHPIWSLDRNDWVELGELEQSEQLSGHSGPATVLSVRILNLASAVYNIEVHGEHVYQVGDIGLFAHNAGHHCNPVAFGNNIPYGHKLLTNLSDAVHGKVHKAMNAFLHNAHGKTLYAGKQWWTTNVNWQERYRTMINFYREFDRNNGTDFFARFMNEVRGGINGGFNPLGM